MEKDRLLLPVAHAAIHTLKKCAYRFEVRLSEGATDNATLLLVSIYPGANPVKFEIGRGKIVNAVVAKKSLPIGNGLLDTLHHINTKILPSARLRLRIRVSARKLAHRWSELDPSQSPEELGKKLEAPLMLRWRGHSRKIGRFHLMDFCTTEQMERILEPLRDLQDPPSPKKIAATLGATTTKKQA